MTYEIVQETPCDFDLYRALHMEDTIYTARWYAERFPDLPDEYYTLLEAVSRDYENSEDIVRKCQESYDSRVQEKLENFGSNRVNPDLDGLECCVDIEEINYDVIKNHELFNKGWPTPESSCT